MIVFTICSAELEFSHTCRLSTHAGGRHQCRQKCPLQSVPRGCLRRRSLAVGAVQRRRLCSFLWAETSLAYFIVSATTSETATSPDGDLRDRFDELRPNSICLINSAWGAADAKCILVTRVCVYLCVCPSSYSNTTVHDPGRDFGEWWGCPLVVHYWADLQSVHGFRCYDNIAPNAKCRRFHSRLARFGEKWRLWPNE